ncbi:MAG: hypothetical protein H6559_21625 [Lewinellaceae bacterium]|nr:hypothetical protein [Lewinellaceae bacterium]
MVLVAGIHPAQPPGDAAEAGVEGEKKKINNLQAQIEAQEEQLGLKEADLKKAEFALREAEARAERIEEEKVPAPGDFQP